MLASLFTSYRFLLVFGLVTIVIISPWFIGFLWMLPDADKHDQPGLIWALVTIPLGWLAVLVYLSLRWILHTSE